MAVHLRRRDICEICSSKLVAKDYEHPSGQVTLALFCVNFKCEQYGKEKVFQRAAKNDGRRNDG